MTDGSEDAQKTLRPHLLDLKLAVGGTPQGDNEQV